MENNYDRKMTSLTLNWLLIPWFPFLLISTFILHMAHNVVQTKKKKMIYSIISGTVCSFYFNYPMFGPAIKQRGVSSLWAHHSHQLLLSHFRCCNSCPLHLSSNSAHRFAPARDTFIQRPRSEPLVYHAGCKCSDSSSITARGGL